MSVSRAQCRAGPPPESAGGRLTIDLDALVANWRELGRHAAPAKAAGVVKADAYGLGLEPVAKALRRAGCEIFFVATFAEGARAREALPDAEIYVLNGMLPGTAAGYAPHRLRPVLGSLPELAEWRAHCDAVGAPQPAALHVDTGMNRLGLRPEEAAALEPADLAAGGIALVMSHFVSAEVPDDPVNRRQLDAFATIAARFPAIPSSLANSAGIFLGPEAQRDLVRPGYALYGGNPTPGRRNPMQPVVLLEAPIVQLREALDGESVGYNSQWTARGRRRLAVLGIGYADGYLRSGSATDEKGGSLAIVAGRRCPFAGRVSMDLIVLDITAVPENAVRRGDVAELIGADLEIDEVGSRLGTNGYEVLTGLSGRYSRVYVGGA